MYYLDLPSVEEVGNLNLVRSDASISIYLATTLLVVKLSKLGSRLII